MKTSMTNMAETDFAPKLAANVAHEEMGFRCTFSIENINGAAAFITVYKLFGRDPELRWSAYSCGPPYHE